MRKVEFYNSKTGWIVGDEGVILYTSTGGNSWNNQSGNPVRFTLSQNYPNPFNIRTTINFSLPKSDGVVINLYDILGKFVKSLVDEDKEPGSYTLSFDASSIASGIYFYRIEAGPFIQTKKMVFLK